MGTVPRPELHLHPCPLSVNKPTLVQSRTLMKTLAQDDALTALEGGRYAGPTPAWMLRHGQKRREGNHVQIRKSTGWEWLVATRHATQQNLCHPLCPRSRRTEQEPVPCALSPEPVGSGAAEAAPWSRCTAPGRCP